MKTRLNIGEAKRKINSNNNLEELIIIHAELSQRYEEEKYKVDDLQDILDQQLDYEQVNQCLIDNLEERINSKIILLEKIEELVIETKHYAKIRFCFEFNTHALEPENGEDIWSDDLD